MLDSAYFDKRTRLITCTWNIYDEISKFENDIEIEISENSTQESVIASLNLLKLRKEKNIEIQNIEEQIFELDNTAIKSYKEDVFQYILKQNKIVQHIDIEKAFNNILPKEVVVQILDELVNDDKIMWQRNSGCYQPPYFIMTDEIRNKRKEVDALYKAFEKAKDELYKLECCEQRCTK